MSAEILRWSSALDSLLVAGPLALTAIERRALFEEPLRAVLPVRVRAAFERLVALGELDALLDLCAWARAATHARAACASVDGALSELERVEAPRIALADQPIERWVESLSTEEASEAAALIATARGTTARETIARVVERSPDAGTVLRSIGSDSDSTDDLIVWVESIDRASGAALLALCRQRSLTEAQRQRMIVASERLELAEDEASECLRALCEHDVSAAVELLFTFLARGVAVKRAVHEAILRAMAFADDPRWSRWVFARIESGEAAGWEIDALVRWQRRPRAR